MADTSLNENRIGLLIWQTSNLWQSKIRKKLTKLNISFNDYLILETVYNLSKIMNNINQVDVFKHSFVDKSVVSAKLNQLKVKKLITKMNSSDNRSNKLQLTKEGKTVIGLPFSGITYIHTSVPPCMHTRIRTYDTG